MLHNFFFRCLNKESLKIDLHKMATHNGELMNEIQKLWYQMFLSTLISSILVHLIGAAVLFVRLRSHHYAKWLAMIVLLAGFLTPLFLGSVTNALIAFILVFSSRYDLPYYVIMLIGVAQTVCVVAVGFLRIIQTLWTDFYSFNIFFVTLHVNNWIMNKLLFFYFQILIIFLKRFQ